MKKIIIFLCLSVFAVPAYAVDMCVSDDAVAIVLDPNITPTSTSYDIITSTWRAVTSYGTIIGVWACLNSNNNLSTFDLYNGRLFDKGILVVGGERNGGNCFCKIIHPVVSLWGIVSYNAFPSVSECVSVCPNYCGTRFNTTFRKALFGSVTN